MPTKRVKVKTDQSEGTLYVRVTDELVPAKDFEALDGTVAALIDRVGKIDQRVIKVEERTAPVTVSAPIAAPADLVQALKDANAPADILHAALRLAAKRYAETWTEERISERADELAKFLELAFRRYANGVS